MYGIAHESTLNFLKVEKMQGNIRNIKYEKMNKNKICFPSTTDTLTFETSRDNFEKKNCHR